MAISSVSEFDRVFTWAVEQARRHTSEQVPPELEPHLRHFFDEFVRATQQEPIDERSLAHALRPLLVYLTTSAGRTDANCWATDLFVYDMPWSDDVPDNELFDVVRYMGEALHDTVNTPYWAENMSSTPEQLLARLDWWMQSNSVPQ